MQCAPPDDVSGKNKEGLSDIHNSLGNKKTIEYFLVDVDFKNESFVIRSIKCISNFINQDYSAKPWNRSSHFNSNHHGAEISVI